MTREAVVAEARSWVSTPYRHRGRAKGFNGGVDCAQLVYLVFQGCGLCDEIPLEQYPPDWHLHRSTERYLAKVLERTRPVDYPQPGDIVLFKVGRCFAHGGVVTQWPSMVHAWKDNRVVCEERADRGRLADREVKFFSRF